MKNAESPRSKGTAVARVVARAPGRLDVMGGIGDYSGSLVLQLPLAVATRATVGFRANPGYEVFSEGKPPDTPARRLTISIDKGREVLSSYLSARSYFADRPQDHWASYALGCLTVLLIEEDAALPSGLWIEIESDVPEGKGVSSSAALEVSVMGALARLLGVELPPERIAHLCQIVENRVAGAPCGIMDQMTAACGKRDHLLSLLCQPAILQDHIAVPKDIAIWGVDSGIRHSVGGSDYGTVRTAASMGYRILAERERLPARRIGKGRVSIIDDRFGGYLSNLGSALLSRHMAQLPELMSGVDFLAAYDGISDDAVSLDPDRSYPVRAATAHPVNEHERSARFASLLRRDATEETLATMGELMYLSHASYSACGLGSVGTDRIVELVKEAGHRKGLYGARITGGGSGGAVAILASSAARASVRQIAAKYGEESGRRATIFEGSSDGLAIEG